MTRTSIRFGVYRVKPGATSPKDKEHRNSHAFVFAAADDLDFHKYVRSVAHAKFPGWSLTGYVIVPAPKVSNE